MMGDLIQTLRPKQWSKNLFIFAGIVFDGQLLNRTSLIRVLIAFILFCLVSGITYTLNDVLDQKADHNHPKKKHRPIASGRLPVRTALVFAGLLSLIVFPMTFWLSPVFGWICVGYTLLMLSYSKWLKKILILDVMTIAAGFLLRVLAGVQVIKVEFFSPWLFVLTALLALFLGFGKRLSELKLLDASASDHREVLSGYSVPLLEQYLTVLLAGILITYCLYTFNSSPHGQHYIMMLTIPFVFYGIFHYMQLLQTDTTASAPEEVLLHDRPLMITVLLWALSVVFVLYIL